MSPDDAGSASQKERQARLAASLKENLKRRKAQQRSRAAEALAAGDDKAAAPASRDPKG